MKQILLTNDDGYEAQGLLALKEALQKKFNNIKIITLAPIKQKSACSHSLTLHNPLRLKKVQEDFYYLDDGTPSDCVYVALSKLFNTKIDLVISGINHGANMGEDISYSGTCGAAMEAVLQGVNALACSLYYKGNSIEKFGFNLACDIVCSVVEKILKNPPPLKKREFLNLNIPAVSKADFKGLKITHTGKRSYDTKLDLRLDPRGEQYIWIGQPSINCINEEGSDLNAVFEGYASLSAIKLDMCAKSSMNELKIWSEDLKL